MSQAVVRARGANRGRRGADPLEVFEGDVWYTATEIARRLSVSRDTVVRWGQSGAVQAMRIGRSVRYHGADLNGLMEPLGAA